MTALRMAQSQDMWQKQTGAPLPGPILAQKSTEGAPIREPTPPIVPSVAAVAPTNAPAGNNANAPHMPHGLTVQVRFIIVLGFNFFIASITGAERVDTNAPGT